MSSKLAVSQVLRKARHALGLSYLWNTKTAIEKRIHQEHSGSVCLDHDDSSCTSILYSGQCQDIDEKLDGKACVLALQHKWNE